MRGTAKIALDEKTKLRESVYCDKYRELSPECDC